MHHKNIKSQLQNFPSKFIIVRDSQKKNGNILKPVKGGSRDFTWILIPHI